MNSTAGNAAMERRLAHAEYGSLWPRVLSAITLAPLPIAAIWFGSPWLPLLTALAGAVMAWEWGRLCRRGRFGATGIVLVGVVLATIAAATLTTLGFAIGFALLGAGIVLWSARGRLDLHPEWTAFGALWVTLPCICLLWLARGGPNGRATLLWVLAVVWATDIGAYVIGRTAGGPRLAPRWSRPARATAGKCKEGLPRAHRRRSIPDGDPIALEPTKRRCQHREGRIQWLIQGW